MYRETKEQMRARLRADAERERLARLEKQLQRNRGTVGVYDFGLPPEPQQRAVGVRVIDGRGSYAVALACDGEYLGLHRRAA